MMNNYRHPERSEGSPPPTQEMFRYAQHDSPLFRYDGGQVCVYILTNTYNTTLYIGVTNNLERRLYEHRSKSQKAFTARYNLHKLVYFEMGIDMRSAIEREKYLKGKTRAFKNQLIESLNPDWQELLPSS